MLHCSKFRGHSLAVSQCKRVLKSGTGSGLGGSSENEGKYEFEKNYIFQLV